MIYELFLKKKNLHLTVCIDAVFSPPWSCLSLCSLTSPHTSRQASPPLNKPADPLRSPLSPPSPLLSFNRRTLFFFFFLSSFRIRSLFLLAVSLYHTFLLVAHRPVLIHG